MYKDITLPVGCVIKAFVTISYIAISNTETSISLSDYIELNSVYTRNIVTIVWTQCHCLAHSYSLDGFM